jgi:hypothetical protein
MPMIRKIAALAGLAFAAQPLDGQRLSELAPGTLVRIATRTGTMLIGPIAEVRGDSVHLSSTLKNPEAILSLNQVQGYEYADGTEPGHGWLGAFIGGALAMSAVLLVGGHGDSGGDGSMFLGGGFLRGAGVVLGAGLGFAIGASDPAPHWVLPLRPASARGRRPANPSAVSVSLRF